MACPHILYQVLWHSEFQDEFSLIPRGWQYTSQILKEAGIPPTAGGYPGGHADQFAVWLLRTVLPHLSATMAP